MCSETQRATTPPQRDRLLPAAISRSAKKVDIRHRIGHSNIASETGNGPSVVGQSEIWYAEFLEASSSWRQNAGSFEEVAAQSRGDRYLTFAADHRHSHTQVIARQPVPALHAPPLARRSRVRSPSLQRVKPARLAQTGKCVGDICGGFLGSTGTGFPPLFAFPFCTVPFT